MKLIFLFILFPLLSLAQQKVLSRPGSPAKIVTRNGNLLSRQLPEVPGPAIVYDYTIYASDYGVSTVNTNNVSAIHLAFAAVTALPASASKLLKFPEGILPCSTKVTMPAYWENVTIEGQGSGATIESKIPVSNYTTTSANLNTPFILFDNSRPTIFSSQTVSSNLVPGEANKTATISTANAALLQPGYFVELRSDKIEPADTTDRLKMGFLKVVQSVNTSTGVVTFTTPYFGDSTIKTTDNIRATAYRPSKNITLKNIHFKLYAGSRGTCLDLRYIDGLNFTRCTFDGLAVMQGERTFTKRTKDSYIGAAAIGYNIVFDSCTAKRFWDADFAFGYGIAVSGENIRIKNTYFEGCKHGITGGISTFFSRNLVADSNYTVDAMLETHETFYDIIFRKNTVTQAGYSTYGFGFYSRGYNTKIWNNYISATQTPLYSGTTTGIYINGQAGATRFEIDSNIIVGFYRGIGTKAINHYSGKVRRNTISDIVGGGYAINLRYLYDCEILNNTINSTAWGLNVTGATNTTIDGNTITYGGINYGGGIHLESNTRNPWPNVTITNNTINPGNSGTNPIRLKNGYNYIFINNNIINIAGTKFTATNSILYSESLTHTRLQITNNTGFSPQINILPP